jgi:diguanylate cyclase (GGDEF)-like protein
VAFFRLPRLPFRRQTNSAAGALAMVLSRVRVDQKHADLRNAILRRLDAGVEPGQQAAAAERVADLWNAHILDRDWLEARCTDAARATRQCLDRLGGELQALNTRLLSPLECHADLAAAISRHQGELDQIIDTPQPRSLAFVRSVVLGGIENIRSALAEREKAEKDRVRQLLGLVEQLKREQAALREQTDRHLAEFQRRLDHAENQAALAQIQAQEDPLTELPNRAAWDAQLARKYAEWARYPDQHVSLCVMMLDIDHFKQVNDTYGHQVGDLVLKRFAQVVARSLREPDWLARLGGEEFGVLVPQTPLNGAKVLAQRVLDAVRGIRIPLPSRGAEITCSVSIGITELAPGDRPQDAVGRADAALYQAKDGGRDRCVALLAGQEPLNAEAPEGDTRRARSPGGQARPHHTPAPEESPGGIAARPTAQGRVPGGP